MYRIFRGSYLVLTISSRKKWWQLFIITALASILSALMVLSIEPFLSALSGSDSKLINSLTTFFGSTNVLVELRSDYFIWGLISVFFIIVSNCSQIIRVWLFNKFSWGVLDDVSGLLLKSYMAKNYAELNSKNPNDLTSKILAEVEKLVLSFYQPLADVISATMTTALVFVVLISVNATVTFSSLGLIALIYIIIYRYSKSEIHKLGLERSVATEKRFKFVIEMFSAVREIKISDNLDFYLKKFKNNSKRLGKSYTKINVIGHVPYFLLQMIILSGIIFICVFLLSSSNMNQEDFVSRLFPLLGVFAFAGQRLMPEINKIFQGATQIKYGMQAMKEMVLEIENYKKRPSFYLDGKAVGEPFQKIELKNVSYTFPNQGKPAVVDINLEIKSGQKILIQGKTGSGKSTLVSLLCGLIMPSKGNIILNNDALDALKIKLFHKDLGYVPQEIAIFDGTIVDNITFGESAENLDMKKVENAAKIASLHDFIMEELPAGYNSKLGDKGSSFSGGQRQRVGIARAIYRDPKILILDEATSALDAETEALVMSNIMLALADRTVISISHSSGQMRYFDSSIQLKGGIVQSNNISLVNN